VGEAEPFVRFYCDNCGYKSTASENYAGKNIRCPNCNYIIFIPKPEADDKRQAASKYSAYDSNLLNVQEQNILKHQQMQEYIASELAYENEEEDEEPPDETDPAAQRKAPWFIDIFLYPLNGSGLKHLAVFILVPPLFYILTKFLPIQLYFLVLLASIIVQVLIFLYMYWYLAECIRESADGWVRAPLGFGGLPSFRDMFEQVVDIIGCLAVFFAPFVLYMLFARKAGVVFWLLLVYAVFLYPMALLAVVMFDSARGFNFRLIFRSISNTFWPYCGLVLFFIATVLLISRIPLDTLQSPGRRYAFRSVIIYAAFVGAHLLGRFYWRYQDRLDWEV
jgi:DNA-directed RNA polymerase subunit RPC12/RpoP